MRTTKTAQEIQSELDADTAAKPIWESDEADRVVADTAVQNKNLADWPKGAADRKAAWDAEEQAKVDEAVAEGWEYEAKPHVDPDYDYYVQPAQPYPSRSYTFLNDGRMIGGHGANRRYFLVDWKHANRPAIVAACEANRGRTDIFRMNMPKVDWDAREDEREAADRDYVRVVYPGEKGLTKLIKATTAWRNAQDF